MTRLKNQIINILGEAGIPLKLKTYKDGNGHDGSEEIRLPNAPKWLSIHNNIITLSEIVKNNVNHINAPASDPQLKDKILKWAESGRHAKPRPGEKTMKK